MLLHPLSATTTTRTVALAAFLAVLAPLTAAARTPSPQAHPNASPAVADRRDAAIFKDVARQVTNYSRFTVFDDVQASVAQGVVTLYGKVTMPYKRDDLARRVTSVAGVRQVVNKIDVLPVSPFDDDLRYRIARAIYGNPSFWHYASMANPPIHIIVRNGRVTLTGVVNNEVEKMLARSLATGFNAFSVDSQLKTDAEARAELERVESR